MKAASLLAGMWLHSFVIRVELLMQTVPTEMLDDGLLVDGVSVALKVMENVIS